VTRLSGAKFFPTLDPRGLAIYALALTVVAATYFGLANLSLTVASIHSSVIPIWAPAGLAFAAVLLCGIRVWPAIFAAAYVAGVPTDLVNESAVDSIPMSLVVATGSTLAPVVGGYLVSIWCGGRNTFDTPAGVAKFVLVVLATTMISATAGIGGLSLAGYLEWTGIIAAWTTWWLRDAAGVLAVAPVVVLWARRVWWALLPSVR
jgi:integral membrane sensor domain MASE1